MQRFTTDRRQVIAYLNRMRRRRSGGGEPDPEPPTGTAYRYWRFFTTGPQLGSASFTGVTEMELRGEVGGADLTSPLVDDQPKAFASSEFNSSYAAHNAFDDAVMAGGGNIWATTSAGKTNAHLGWDFGTPTVIRQAYITGLNNPDQSPADLLFQGSDDNVVWNDVFDAGVQTWTAMEGKAFEIQ